MRRFLILVFSVFYFTLSRGQAPRDFQKEAALLIHVLNKNHYKPAILDNSFSNEVLTSYTQQLDPGHLYFNEQEILSLDQFKDSLDDEWKGAPWNFLNRVTGTYREALKRGEAFLSDEITKPVAWESTEMFLPQGKQVPWSKNEKEQRSRWRLWVRYKILSYVRENHGLDSGAATGGVKFIRSHESEWRQRVLVAEQRRVRRILENPNGFENSIGAIYFRTVTTYFDPHSLYFSPRDYEHFREALSTKKYSFGFGLNEDQEGNILIERLVPGGPAWKSGEIHKGDVLTELRWQGQSPFDLAGIGLDEFVQLLDRGNSSEAEFMVRQSNGVKKAVLLRKEKISSEDNTVKGFVLKGKRKIGYISLPGFYTEWDSDEQSSCANDVAAEIIKLKGESVEGLILDIRSNGGGSLKEAIEMAGIFIEEGPMAMIGDKSGKALILKDMNRGVVYDGPLILLIDGQSASASELLAAAIQDYHRGIIAGSPSFGKATVQSIFPMDTVRSLLNDSHGAKPDAFGYATVTVERLYRVTGKSNQGVGVTPDLKLPDLYDLPTFHEMSLPRAFTRDSIVKKSFYKPLPEQPVAELSRRSIERIRQSEAFSSINAVKELLAESMKETGPVSLKWDNFMRGRSNDPDGARHEPGRPAPFEITSPEFNKIRMGMDTYLQDFTASWIKNLMEDPYVTEAFYIATDCIQLKSKK